MFLSITIQKCAYMYRDLLKMLKNTQNQHFF